MVLRLVALVCFGLCACGRSSPSADDVPNGADDSDADGDAAGDADNDVGDSGQRAFDFIDCDALPAGAAFRRGSPATVHSASGIVKVAADVPRCERDAVSQAAVGLLIEPASTNHVEGSEQFDITLPDSWFENDGGAVDLDVAVAPDGTSTADRVRDTSNAARSRVAFGSPDDGVFNFWTCSVFLKADTAGGPEFACEILGGTSIQQVSINVSLSDGSIAGQTGNHIASYSVVPAGNGWWRVSISILENGSGNTGVILSVYPDGIFAGADRTGSVFAWGAQIENHFGPTSYIPTPPGEIATRESDVLDLANVMSGGPGGTVLAEADVTGLQRNQESYLFDANSGDAEWMLRLGPDESVTRAIPSAKAFAGPLFVITDMPDARWQVGASHTIATSLTAAGELRIAMDGVSGGAQIVSGAIPTFADFRIGRNRSDAAFFRGHLRRIVTWPEAFSDERLRAVTAP